jgi:hypothetical protein
MSITVQRILAVGVLMMVVLLAVMLVRDVVRDRRTALKEACAGWLTSPVPDVYDQCMNGGLDGPLTRAH